jgi:Fanconi anemia group M protein
MNQSSLTGNLISPKIKSEIMNSPYLIKDLIEARDYQVSIAKKCVGKNYLVSIPTGLGKTIIAILVAAKTLELYPPESKIIMLAPTKPLVVQHAVSFRKFLNVEIPEFCLLKMPIKILYVNFLEK